MLLRRSGMQRDGGITDHSGALGSRVNRFRTEPRLRFGRFGWVRGNDPDVQVASTMLKKSRRACATWSGASRAA